MALLITADNESFISTIIVCNRPTILLVKLGLAADAESVKKLLKSGQVYHAKAENPHIFWPVLTNSKLQIADGDIIQCDEKKIKVTFTSVKIEVDADEIQ